MRRQAHDRPLATTCWLQRVLGALLGEPRSQRAPHEQRPIIGFAGMTHLGLVLGDRGRAARASTTIGFDADAALVARLDAGQLPVVEPGLDELAARQPQPA